MKKFLTLTLTIVMLMSLAACGSKNKKTNSGEVSQSEISTQEIPETEGTEEVTTVPETAPESAFDTSWASNEFEKWIPKLPFEGFEATEESETVYKIETSGLKTGVITDSDGKTIGYSDDTAALIKYLDSLKEYGFSVTETGGIPEYPFKWLVVDTNGNEIEITCAEGYCWVVFTKVE